MQTRNGPMAPGWQEECIFMQNVGLFSSWGSNTRTTFVLPFIQPLTGVVWIPSNWLAIRKKEALHEE